LTSDSVLDRGAAAYQNGAAVGLIQLAKIPSVPMQIKRMRSTSLRQEAISEPAGEAMQRIDDFTEESRIVFFPKMSEWVRFLIQLIFINIACLYFVLRRSI